MTVRHEDRIFYGVIGAASVVAFLLACAIFSTQSWAVGGKLAVFAIVFLLWACAVVPTTIYYFEERDKRIRQEKERWEAEEERRLHRLRLEERNGD